MASHLEGGHTETILCCAVTGDQRIISGGEGGQICVWSLDGSAPQKNNVSENGDDVVCIYPSKLSHQTYVACGTNIHCFDSRQWKNSVFTFHQNKDEINQIILNENESFLAACDDSGQIKVYNVQEKQVYKTLEKHTNICACMCFRPRRPWDLLSGGFDNMLLQWDFSRGRSVCNIDMSELYLDEPLQSSYSVSPPFIYSMSISPSGHQVVCGTENGLVQLFDASQRTLAFISSLTSHRSGVSQVHYLPNHDNLLVSGGNDGYIMLWNTSVQPNQYNDLQSTASSSANASNDITNGDHSTILNGVSNGASNGIQNGNSSHFNDDISNGLQNGVSNGVSNGVPNVVQNHMSDSLFIRLSNGISNGVANGIHNDVSNRISNGVHQSSSNSLSVRVHNDLYNGAQNSISNGVPNGISNGVSNGIANGVSNGIANGVHHSNGSNSYSNGHIRPSGNVNDRNSPVVHNGVSNGVHDIISNVHNETEQNADLLSNVIFNINNIIDGQRNGSRGNRGIVNGRPSNRRNNNRSRRNNRSQNNPNEQYQKLLQRPKFSPIMQIAHDYKIQWLSSLSRNGQTIVVVADNSCDLSLYNIPNR